MPVFCMFACACLQPVFAEEQPADDAKKPAELVKLLETGDFDEREAAVEDLEALGEQAREALQNGLKNAASYGVRKTIEGLLRKLKRAQLTVHAFDRNGKPLSNAEVDVKLSYSTPQVQMDVSANKPKQDADSEHKTDKQGRLTVDALAPDRVHNVTLKWKGLFRDPWTGWINQVYLKGGMNHVFTVLVKGGAVAGKVMGAKDEKPLKDATISLVRDSGQPNEELLPQGGGAMAGMVVSQPQYTGSTDADGAFKIDEVPEGFYRAIASFEDHRNAYVGPLEVRWGKTARIETFRLVKKAGGVGTMKLFVLGPDGKPYKKKKVFVDTQLIPTAEEAEAHRKEMLKRIWSRRFSGGQNPGKETEDDGSVLVEDLKEGTYRVVIRREKGVPVVIEDLKVTAGKTIEIPGTKAGKGGKIKGKLIFSGSRRWARIYVMDEADPECLAVLSNVRRHASWFWWGFRFKQGQNQGYRRVQNDGSYTLSDIAPGKYTLYITGSTNQAGLIHGLEVKDGETTNAPDLKLPEGARSVSSSRQRIQGEAKGPDGKPIPAGTGVVFYDSGHSNRSNFSNGKFSFGWPSSYGQPVRLVLSASGYRPLHLDLKGKSGADLTTLKASLEMQRYGRILVTVKDPEGKPLKDVLVSPKQAQATRYGYRAPRPSRTRATNAEGKVVLKGLAWGERTFNVKLPGHYVDRPVKGEVKPDQDTALEVVLKPGLRASGSVKWPKDAKPSAVWVYLRDEGIAARVTQVNERGEFTFSGLAPGTFRLRAEAPGLVCPASVTVPLSGKGDTKPVTLELARPGALSVALGEEGRGATLTLAEPGQWDPSKKEKAATGQTTRKRQAKSEKGNSTGLARFSGVAPGIYDLLVTRTHHHDWPVRMSHGRVPSTTRVFSDVRVESATDSGKPVRFDLTPKDSAAKVVAQIMLADKAKLKTQQRYGSMSLTLIGPQIRSRVRYSSFPHDLLSSLPGIVVVGTPPEPTPPPEKPGSITIENLPAGDYRLYLQISEQRPYYNRAQLSWKGVNMDPRLLRSFKLESKQTLDLGEIKIEVPEEIKKRMRRRIEEANEGVYGGLVGEDKPE